MREQQFQRTGITDTDQIAELGKLANADYVVSGHITRLGSRNLLMVSIINVETMEQTAGDYREYGTIEEVYDLLPDVAKAVAASVRQTGVSRGPLAVLPLDIQAGEVAADDAELLAQILATEIANTHRYNVLPRTTAIQDAIKTEQGVQQSGLTDRATLAAIGKATNARYVLSGTITRLGELNLFDVKILDVTTGGRIVGSDRRYRSLEDGIVLMRELAREITGVAAEEAAEAEAARTLRVGSSGEFTAALAAIGRRASGEYRIVLTANITLNAVDFSLPSKTVVMRAEGSPRTLFNRSNAHLFTVGRNTTLILENNVTLNGNRKKYSAVYIKGGELVMRAGSAITGAGDSGVWVDGGGAFTMEGGAISGNTASFYGGGVYVFFGRFTKSGGTIYGGSDARANTASRNGHAVYDGRTAKQRDSTAGPSVSLNSGVNGKAGGWE
jgi:TolB-like protein